MDKERQERAKQRSKDWYYSHHEEAKARSRQYQEEHKEERAKNRKKYYLEHQDEAKERARKWAAEHPEQKKATHKRYYDEHSEEIIKYVGKWQKDNREKVNKKNREFAYNCRVEALTHYGGGKLACVRCGESDIRCLSIDHINGGGNQHRRELGGKGIKLSQILRRQSFPEGYQTLCMNCQFKKRHENHEVGYG